eukprot:Colp12_sorted_trinity150504_noHs@26031
MPHGLVLQLSPASVVNYADKLQKGFDKIYGDRTKCVVATENEPSAGYISRVTTVLGDLQSTSAATDTQLILIQWHGAEYEQQIVGPATQMLSGHTQRSKMHIVLVVHRPEEIILRYGVKKVTSLHIPTHIHAHAQMHTHMHTH